MSTAEQSNWNACATKLQISLKSLPLGHGTICHYPLFPQKKKKKSQGHCGGESNQLSSYFFSPIFLCLKRYVAESCASSSQRLSHEATSWPLLNSAQMASADQLRHFWTTGSGEVPAAEPIERRFQRRHSWMTEQRRSRITCDLDVHVSVQQQVLRLEIPVDDVAVVAVLHRRQDLPELPPGLDLAQPPVLRQVVCGRTGEKKQEVISCGVASSAYHTLSDALLSPE